MAGPLSGIRVVDFSRVLAGPLCARTLQDLGAEVIKVEPPSPDVSRFAFPSTDGMSGYYAQQNAGKRNVSINLNIPGAYELALKLCDTADIVVENFRAGTLGFFGLDYETLSKRNPRLIYASITGYGQGGPWRSRMAYAPTVQAEAGFTENSVRHYGEALTEPRTDSLSHADVYAGLQAVIAILAALNSRQKTGQGQYIDVAMAATLLAVNERAHVDLSDDDIGAEPAVLGATDCSFFTGPQGEHFTVATSIVGSRTFPSWLRAMRRVRSDGRSAIFQRRGAAAEFRRAASDHPVLDADIPGHGDARCAVRRSQDRDGRNPLDQGTDEVGVERLLGRGTARSGPQRRRIPTAGPSVAFLGDELTPIGTPAFQGEHNKEVFRELGVSEAELQRLSEAGVLVTHRRALEPEAAIKPQAAAGQAA